MEAFRTCYHRLELNCRVCGFDTTSKSKTQLITPCAAFCLFLLGRLYLVARATPQRIVDALKASESEWSLAAVWMYNSCSFLMCGFPPGKSAIINPKQQAANRPLGLSFYKPERKPQLVVVSRVKFIWKPLVFLSSCGGFLRTTLDHSTMKGSSCLLAAA